MSIFKFNYSLGFLLIVGSLVFMPLEQVNAYSKYRWNLGNIGVTKSMHQNSDQRGTNVKVGVFDGYAKCNHKELKGRCENYNWSDGVYNYYNDHGTHVATTIAAENIKSGGIAGVAPKAEIYSYALFDDYGWVGGSNLEKSTISHAKKKGVRVINMSYGCGPPPCAIISSPGGGDVTTMAKSTNKHIVFVKSAGNSGLNLTSLEMSTNFNAYKKLDNYLIVGSTNKNNKISSFSNTPGEGCFLPKGKTKCKTKNQYMYYFVVAPGNKIKAGIGNGKYKTYSGTSMAAPHVTGLVALLQGYWPVLKKRPGAVVNIITHTAKDLGAKGVDKVYGWGLVQADGAMGPVGKKYLKKKTKKFSLSSSGLKASQALAALTSESFTFFDEYDRDFAIPLASIAPSYSGTLNRWMTANDSRRDVNHNIEDGLSFVVDTEQYNPNNPSLSDIFFHLNYREGGLEWHLGQGDAIERLNIPANLSFGLMDKQNGPAGAYAYPVLSIAEGGTYGLFKQQLGQGFSLTSGVLSNTRLDSNDEDRGYAPKANALVLSLDRISKNRKLSGHVTATYLTEEDGVLGTGGVGGLHFTDGFDSNAITVGTQYRMPDDYSLSASYTTAFSQGDTVSDGLLSLESNRLISTAFAVGLEKQKLATNNDHLKFSISQPLRVDSGSMTLTHDDYYDEDEVLHSRTVGIDLGQSGRQIDYQLQYTTPLTKNRNLGLFVYYAQDYLHQAHQDDYGIGIRLKGTY